jgi:hypothetical protein
LTYEAKKYNGTTAYVKSNLGNDYLGWETTVQYNAGIDAGVLKDRLVLVADVYYKKTSDLLFAAPTSFTEAGTQLENIGNVTNKGVEFALNASIIDAKDFTWNVSANIARNINTITNLGNYDSILLGRDQEEVLQTGESLGSFYGLVFDGIVQNGENVSLLPTTTFGTPQPGDLKFADVSGSTGEPDGKIDGYDRVVLGNNQPDFTYGFSSNLTFKGFDLFVSLQGSRGNQIYNHLRRFLERPRDSYNASKALLDRWTESNPSTIFPNAKRSYPYSFLDSRYVEDASYLRLKNITLGYTLFPIKQTPGVKLRIFASAQNLFTLTPYKGYDPEVARGIDLGIYPTARIFSAGVNLSF